MTSPVRPIQAFVLAVTLIREAFDDIFRFMRDREMNNRKYERLTPYGTVSIPSRLLFLSIS